MNSNVKINTPADIGRIIRKKRKEDGLSLTEAAALCNVGYRFLSDLENGKATAQLNKVLQVLRGLGINLWLRAGDDND